MITLDDYQAVRRKVEAAQSRLDQARGALAQLQKQLKAEFGVTTLAEARRLYNKRLAREHDAAEGWNKSLAAFKKKHKDILEGRYATLERKNPGRL